MKFSEGKYNILCLGKRRKMLIKLGENKQAMIPLEKIAVQDKLNVHNVHLQSDADI